MFLQKGIDEVTNQAINMALKNTMSPLPKIQSPFGKAPLQRIKSYTEMNDRFKQL